MNLQYKLKSGRSINIELQSGRTAILSSSTILINEERLNKKITKLSFEDNLEIKLNNILEFKIENKDKELKLNSDIKKLLTERINFLEKQPVTVIQENKTSFFTYVGIIASSIVTGVIIGYAIK